MAINPMELLANKRVVAIDIETTGFNRKKDFVIEVGMIEYINGEAQNKVSMLFGGGRSHPDAVAVHGISDESRAGLPLFTESADSMSQFLSGSMNDMGLMENTIIIGHNAVRFDIPFINAALDSVGYCVENIRIIDTLSLARLIQPKNNSLGVLCESRNIEYGNHRALADIESTMEIYKHLINELNTEHGYSITTLEDIFLVSKMKKDLSKEDKHQITNLMSI